MIYVFDGGSVVFDETTLTEADKLKGLVMEKLPLPEQWEGYTSVLKCNVAEQQIWYEYEPVPMPEGELRVALAELAEAQEQERLNTQLALAELAESMIGGNA